jgi:hypothetical protein
MRVGCDAGAAASCPKSWLHVQVRQMFRCASGVRALSARSRGPSTAFRGPALQASRREDEGAEVFSPLSRSDGGVRPKAGRGPGGTRAGQT